MRDEQFLKWLMTQDGLSESLLSRIPDAVFGPEMRKAKASLLSGKTWESSVEPMTKDEAKEFLIQQMLAILGREVGKAQKTGELRNLKGMLDVIEDCSQGFEAPPIHDFTDIVPKDRRFIPTGIVSVDTQIRGLADAELGILALPPGKGKTWLLINITNTALVYGLSVLYITVADQGRDEIVPRFDTRILQRPEMSGEIEEIEARHKEAIAGLKGKLWIADFTDRTCSIADVERAIRERPEVDLVIVDHADDVTCEFSSNPEVTRHSLRTVYLALKRLAVKYNVPVWTASQTGEHTWSLNSADITAMAEAKTGKATGAGIVLVFTGGNPERAGIMLCSLAKARRKFTRRVIEVYVDQDKEMVW